MDTESRRGASEKPKATLSALEKWKYIIITARSPARTVQLDADRIYARFAISNARNDRRLCSLLDRVAVRDAIGCRQRERCSDRRGRDLSGQSMVQLNETKAGTALAISST
jgi:hypothetical protein